MTNLTPSAANLLATETPCFGIGSVVSVGNSDFLAEDASGRVDIGRGLIDAVLHLRAGRRAWPGNGPTHAEFNLSRGCSLP